MYKSSIGIDERQGSNEIVLLHTIVSFTVFSSRVEWNYGSIRDSLVIEEIVSHT